MLKFNPQALIKLQQNEGWRDSELARQMKKYIPTMSRSTIYEWKKHGKQPKSHFVQALCKVFGLANQDVLFKNFKK